MTEQNAPEDSGFDAENPYALTQLERQVVDLLIGGLTGRLVRIECPPRAKSVMLVQRPKGTS